MPRKEKKTPPITLCCIDDPKKLFPPSKRKAPKVRWLKDEQTELLCYIDDVPEFHDPFSELSLFLSQEIKNYMCSSGASQKWSLKIQEELIHQINPRFKEKFPTYRLTLSALRKAWEKISSILQQIRGEKEALTQAGQLNLCFFIRQHLKRFLELQNSELYRPALFTQQLALKMSEYIALVDGVRPELEDLIKVIWAVEKHLIQDEKNLEHQSPYDQYDKIDQFIVKQIIEIYAKEPLISHSLLEYEVKERLKSLKDLPKFSTHDQLVTIINAFFAESLYSDSILSSSLVAEEIEALFHFINRHIDLCKKSKPTLSFQDLIKQIAYLYALAVQLPKHLTHEEVNRVIEAIYKTPKEEKALSLQSLYAFFFAQAEFVQDKSLYYSTDDRRALAHQLYLEAKALPSLRGKNRRLIEIIAWKILSKKEGILTNLPYKFGQLIEKEIGSLLVQNPEQDDHTLIQKTAKCLQRAKDVAETIEWTGIEKKIRTWVIQGELVYRFIHFKPASPLLHLIQAQPLDKKQGLTSKAFVAEIAHMYLQKYPDLTPYAELLDMWISIFCKSHWYIGPTEAKKSSFDRFVQWHIRSFTSQKPHLSEQELSQLIEDQCLKSLPFFPLEKSRVQALFASSK